MAMQQGLGDRSHQIRALLASFLTQYNTDSWKKGNVPHLKAIFFDYLDTLGNNKVKNSKNQGEGSSLNRAIQTIKNLVGNFSDNQQEQYFLHYCCLTQLCENMKIKMQEMMELLNIICQKDNFREGYRGVKKGNKQLKFYFAAFFFEPLIFLFECSIYMPQKQYREECKKMNSLFIIRLTITESQNFTLLDGRKLTIDPIQMDIDPHIKPRVKSDSCTLSSSSDQPPNESNDQETQQPKEQCICLPDFNEKQPDSTSHIEENGQTPFDDFLNQDENELFSPIWNEDTL